MGIGQGSIHTDPRPAKIEAEAYEQNTVAWENN
jgi:hypothetical protein